MSKKQLMRLNGLFRGKNSIPDGHQKGVFIKNSLRRAYDPHFNYFLHERQPDVKCEHEMLVLSDCLSKCNNDTNLCGEQIASFKHCLTQSKSALQSNAKS